MIKPPIPNTTAGRKKYRIYERDGFACLKCGESDFSKLTIDHIRALAMGGSKSDVNN